MPEAELEHIFPNLAATGYRVTSPITPDYNCIAWAAEKTETPWWPVALSPYHWPIQVPRVVSVQAFEEGFRTLGCEPCAGGQLEAGVEKVAIYADQNGEPTHMARQLRSDAWTSKLGDLEDIEHQVVDGVEGDCYGRVVRFLKRKLPSDSI